MLNNLEQFGYKPLPINYFDDGHTYELDGLPMIGTTTILKMRAKEYLVAWASKEAVKKMGYYDENYYEQYINRNGNIGFKAIKLPDEVIALGRQEMEKQFEFIKDLTPDQYYQFLIEAKNSYAQKSRDARDTGNIAHDLIEESIKNETRTFPIKHKLLEGLAEIQLKEVENAWTAWLNWEKTHAIEYLAVELVAGSRSLWTAGTVDAIAKVDSNLELLDWKTNKQISDDVFLQTSAYQFYFEENGFNQPLKRRTVRLDKATAQFEDLPITSDYQKDLECFKALLISYRWGRDT